MAVNINVPSQVKTYANLAAFPATGALKTIYIAEDTNKTYRWTGSVYVEVSASASGITIGTTAITSGTVGRVLFQGTGNVVSQSANLFWDNTNGTLEATTTADNLFGLRLKSTTGQLRVKPYLNSTYGVLLESKNAADSAYLPMSFSSSKHLFLDGNVIINSTSDAGFKLDVNGTARFKDTGSAASIIMQYGTGGWIAVNNAGGTEAIRLRGGGGPSYFNTGQNVLIGTTTDAGFRLDVNGTARATQITATTTGGSFNIGSVNVVDFGDGLRIGYSSSVSKISLFTNSGTQGLQVNNGSVSIGPQLTPNASAILDLTSTTKGFLPPRMTTTQKNAIATPAAGLMVYDTTLNVISYYNGTMWI